MKMILAWFIFILWLGETYFGNHPGPLHTYSDWVTLSEETTWFPDIQADFRAGLEAYMDREIAMAAGRISGTTPERT